jgi:hypothetical protein
MVGRIMAISRQRAPYEDTVDSILDRLGNIREEVVAIERSLERMQAEAAKVEQRTDGAGKRSR